MLRCGVVANLRVGHIVPDTEAEGPGRRFAVWVQGCPLRCAGCCNPELLAFAGGVERDTAGLAAEILAAAVRARAQPLEGVTFLGGEPFAQAEAVLDVAERVRATGLSIMIFTGYTLAELRAHGRADIDVLIATCDLLVDGRYQRDQPDTSRRWIGSRNQIMHVLSDRYREDDPRFLADNTIEIRLGPGGLVVNGWPGAADAVVGGNAGRCHGR